MGFFSTINTLPVDKFGIRIKQLMSLTRNKDGRNRQRFFYRLIDIYRSETSGVGKCLSLEFVFESCVLRCRILTAFPLAFL